MSHVIVLLSVLSKSEAVGIAVTNVLYFAYKKLKYYHENCENMNYYPQNCLCSWDGCIDNNKSC